MTENKIENVEHSKAWRNFKTYQGHLDLEIE
jgi:hypothetical protein